MDIGLHQLAQGLVDPAMPRQWQQAGESFAGDIQRVMAAAVAGTFMAGMAMAFVEQFQLRGLKRRQRRKNPLAAIAHGSTGLNGRTSTPLYTPAAR